MAYDDLEPIGEWRADYRIAMLCSLVMNIAQSVWGGKGKLAPVSPLDFMPNWGGERTSVPKPPEPKRQSVEEMKKILQEIARFHKTTGRDK